MILDRLDGPGCPKCGCPDADVLRSDTRWGRGRDKLRCRHCGARWYETEPPDDADDDAPGVVYHVVRCPHCDSADQRVYKTQRSKSEKDPTIRYHKCRACDKTFKSVEKR